MSPVWLLLAAVTVALQAAAAELTLKSPRIAFVTAGGELRDKQDLFLEGPLRFPVELNTSDVLRFSFQIVEKESGEGVQPHQVFLRFLDKSTEEEGIVPLRVSTSGKVKFDLNVARLPTGFPPTTKSQLQTTLIVGSFVHSPAKWNLVNLKLPPSPPPPEHVDQALYAPLPAIHHTFRPDQKSPYKVVSAVFTALVVSPWIGLVAALTLLPQKYPNLASVSTLPFLLLLGSLESLLYIYWVHLKIWDVLFYGFVLGGLTIVAGNHALSSLKNKQ